jgi:hypothetical protein
LEFLLRILKCENQSSCGLQKQAVSQPLGNKGGSQVQGQLGTHINTLLKKQNRQQAISSPIGNI